MDTCTAEFARLSAGLGGSHCDGNPIVTFTNPLGLQSWTMPVIELLLITSAVASLLHALWWRRTTADSSNLVLWICSIVSLLLIEPIAYFPQWFGLEELMGLTFVHNQFSVQFLYDRLPLYIVAMYPAYAYWPGCWCNAPVFCAATIRSSGQRVWPSSFIVSTRSWTPLACSSDGGCGTRSFRRRSPHWGLSRW